MFPLARTEKLTIQELSEELVVFDLATNKVHCLNQASALIWKHCDGQTSLEQLAQIISRELHIASPAAVVQLSLEQLSNRGLLQKPLQSSTGQARIHRREALKKLVAAGVGIPVILSITAPKAMAAMSVFNCLPGSVCTTQNPCQTGTCTPTGNAGSRVWQCVYTPVAEGFPCGVGMVCRGGNCVAAAAPPPPPPPNNGGREGNLEAA